MERRLPSGRILGYRATGLSSVLTLRMRRLTCPTQPASSETPLCLLLAPWSRTRLQVQEFKALR